MFPIPWNKAYRDKDGSIKNISDMGGGGGGESLPPHSVADAGKLLGVANDNSLAWISASSLHMYEVTTNQLIVGKMFVLTTVDDENLSTFDKLKSALTTGIGFIVSGMAPATTHVPTFAKYEQGNNISVYSSMQSESSNNMWYKSNLLNSATVSSTKLF